MHENKIFFNFFCFNISEKTKYFNVRFVSLRYKNINQYYTKLIEKYAKNHIFFQKIFGNFFFAGPDPT